MGSGHAWLASVGGYPPSIDLSSWSGRVGVLMNPRHLFISRRVMVRKSVAVWQREEDCNYGTLPCALHDLPSGQGISSVGRAAK